MTYLTTLGMPRLVFHDANQFNKIPTPAKEGADSPPKRTVTLTTVGGAVTTTGVTSGGGTTMIANQQL